MASGRVTILGCGGSGGVPLVTGYWGACDPANPKNRRMRASIAVEMPDTTIMVDTGPDFHIQTLTYRIKNIGAVLYTHGHSDHVNGIDELRYLKYIQKQNIDIWGDLNTLSELQARFAHMFVASPDGIYEAVVNTHVFNDDDFGRPHLIAGHPVVPYWQKHGTAGRSVGYRFGNFAYSTDVSGLDDAAFEALKGVDTWLVDCAQFGSDFTVVHANFDMVAEWNTIVKARRVILTHMTPRIDYKAMADYLPKGYEPAYDGMVIDISTGT